MTKPRKPQHILFVLEHFAPMRGGVETLFLALCQQLARAGYRVTVITTLPDTSVPRVEIEGLMTIRRYRFLNRFAFTMLALGPILRYGRSCTLIHTTSYNAGIPAFLGGVLMRKPVVITFHEVWSHLWFELPFLTLPLRLAFYWYEQLLVRLPFNRFVAVSKSTANQLQNSGVSPSRIRLVYNGVDYSEIDQLAANVEPRDPDSSWTITYFGRLGISKGLELIIPAFASLLNHSPECRLQFNIPETPRNIRRLLEQQVEDLGLHQSVRFLEPADFQTLIKRIKHSDAVVIPSWTEGFCFAAAEAMAVGTPIISSGLTALAEVVGGKHVVMTAQTSEALAEALSKARVGKWSVSTLPHFDLGHTISGYTEIYRELSS